MVILGPKREEETGGWRKFYNGEVQRFYSPNYCYDAQIKKDEIDGTCCAHDREKKYIQNFDRQA
jgi:hypothetical protein